MKNLQLSLTRNWFEMTNVRIKREDYREITPYWVKRLLNINLSQEKIEGGVIHELITDLNNLKTEKCRFFGVLSCLSFYDCSFKKFDSNIMTLGYPKSTDSARILKLEHKGIEIGTGNPKWGAEEGKLYFIIKHGSKI